MTRAVAGLAIALVQAACGPAGSDEADAGPADAGEVVWPAENFATRVISFTPGPNSGFGSDRLPDVVLGAPRGGGAASGSLDVLSLGNGGEVVLSFDRDVVDGEGADLLVFENPFPPFVESGVVGVSVDGTTWVDFPCTDSNAGCAGLNAVLAHPANGLDPTDPAVAGGDAFDLATVGLSRARYVRVRDTGRNTYLGSAGGFDLDAVAIVHGAAP